MVNLQSGNKERKYYIPMEVTAEIIRDFGINPAEVIWAKIGNQKLRAVMIPVSKEQYYEYMRPLWREAKRIQRQKSAVSLDELYENTEYEAPDDTDLESAIMKKLLITELHKALDELDEADRTIMEMYAEKCSETEIGHAIGMSQRGVNKRKKKILMRLNSRLKEFR